MMRAAMTHMFSVFTPTHDFSYLLDTYQSLISQSYADWEWVLVPNNCPGATLPEAIRQDKRVHIYPAPDHVARSGVGALKRFACEKCSGNYLVELDHDDRLTPDALERIGQAILETQAGFLYSDFANFYPDGTCQVYDAAYGWENYPIQVDGNPYTVMRSFDIDPSAFSAIFFAPNHVRVWSREAYDLAGGFDANLPLCDDFDLICRTYLAGAKFHHIPECLYLYRMQAQGNNTHLQRNQEIQQRQQQVANRYFYAVIDEWCRRHDLPKIDLGGATGCPEGFQSVDVVNADHCCDIRQGLPFQDNSVGCVRAYDFLEHIPTCRSADCDHGEDGTSPRCVVGVMNEIYRVLVPGGWLISRTPSTDGRGAFQDPTHASFWNPNSFWYYTRKQQAQYVRGIACRFQGNRVWQEYPSPWHEQHKILYVYADLVALKGQRQAGLCEI